MLLLCGCLYALYAAFPTVAYAFGMGAMAELSLPRMCMGASVSYLTEAIMQLIRAAKSCAAPSRNVLSRTWSVRLSLLFVALAGAQCGAVAAAQQSSGLAMERVVLSTAGVGYFQHGGQVHGDAAVELVFTPTQLNDVLKSLVVQDAGGGRVSAVGYPSQEPLDRLLGSFAVDLSGHPSLTELLGQLRGAEVRLALDGGQTIAGRVLGTETRPQGVGQAVVEATYVSIVSASGVRTVDLASVRSFELADAHLKSELEKALVALAEGRNTLKRTLTVQFSGSGARRVAVGYVVEAPIWKTSYRLVLPASAESGKAVVQGWAIVENTSEHDWNKVDLALVSGRPLSFIEDLYQPQYVARPVHQSQRFNGIGPQSYELGMAQDAASEGVAQPGERKRMAMPASAPMMMAAPAPARAQGGADITSAVQSVAGIETLGATFQYTVGGVSVARHGSAMLPIIAETVEVEQVSIYDPAVLGRHPLRGVRMTNSTGKHLPAGPVTVLEGDTYAGDARLEDVAAGGERLLSFAVDLDVSVQRRDPGSESTLVGAKIERGVLQLQQQRARRTAYALKSETTTKRHIVLTHAASHGWDLIDTPKPMDRTEAQYRFGFDLAAGASHEFVIQESRTDWESLQISRFDERAIAVWAGNGRLPQTVRDALTRAAQLRRDLAANEHAVAVPQQRVAELTAEQERIRANLQTLQRGTPLHDRLISKLNEQETELEALQKEIATARTRLEAARAALDSYLANLSVS